MRKTPKIHGRDFILTGVFFLFLVCVALHYPACRQVPESHRVINNQSQGLLDGMNKAVVIFSHVFTLGAEEGDRNQTFYRPSDVAIDELGNIYVLDSGNLRIQVFNPFGRFLRTLGKGGQGPGELSNKTRLLTIDNNEDLLYVFDAGHRRLTILDMDGGYKGSWSVQHMDDLVFDARDWLVASDFLLREDHTPIHRYNRDGKLIASFGSINEPGNNLLEMVTRSPYRDVEVLSYYSMTKLAMDHEGNIYYSQKNPYLIHKYSPQGSLLFKFTRQVPFSTLHSMVIEVSEQEVRKSIKGPMATIGQIAILQNELIAVPVFSPNKDINCVDFYRSDGKLLLAAPLPTKLDGPSTYIVSTVFDHENNFYCLYGSADTFPKLEKYAMTIDLK